jgi:hypothetical protein
MLKIAILSGPENGSPRVLAETLDQLIKETGYASEIFYQSKAIRRLLSANQVKVNKILWFLFKLKNFMADRRLFAKLREKDAVVICDWTPHGFYKDTYNIPKFKTLIDNKPVLYYAVQYLWNSPTIIQRLKDGNHDLQERYDWHLSVSPVTELRGTPAPPWSQIGMNLKSTGLKPVIKKEFLAIVDFLRPGYEQYRETQIKVLEELKIKYISFEREYSVSEIRELYKMSGLIFLQFPEAYGLPIAECLACGSYIGTPDTSWPMSWRLDEKLEVHGPGTLPECFLVYNGAEELKTKLIALRDNYDLAKTPQKVFDTFYKYYPTFYEGNKESLLDVFKRIEQNNLH